MPKPLSILILEDVPADFEIAVRELRRAGFNAQCRRVDTEQEYVNELLKAPDAILSDYVLPGFDALGALRILKEFGLDIPFIVLTGAVSEGTVVECMKRGAADYLLKDRLTRLGPAVTRALKERQLRRQKRESETALKKANDRFQQLVETTNAIPWELDLQTSRFTYVGPQAVVLLGYSLEEWYRDGFWARHIHPEDGQTLAGLQSCLDAPSRDYDFTCHMLNSHGVKIWLRCLVKATTCDRDTRLLRGFMIDITDLKAAQQSLARRSEDLAASNAELQQFASVASHDLQEPLRMVTFYTQLLAERYKGKLDSDADEIIGYARDGAMRMAELIKRLLEYSGLSAHKPEFALTDSEAIFQQSLSNLKVAIDESGASVSHDQLPPIKADSSQIGQLFQNLIGNAIKFRGEAAPHIHLSAREDQAEWLFSLKDDGIGIEPQYFETIFGIFQRLHGRDDYPGSGVGLAICRKIVERHRGRIWVQSDPGHGSEFSFTIAKDKENTR